MTSTGNLSTTGFKSHGILGRSSGKISVLSTANISTTGSYAHGDLHVPPVTSMGNNHGPPP